MTYTLIKVGNKNRPADADDIRDMRSAITKARRQGKDFVWHHAVDIEMFDVSDREIVVWKLGDDERPASPDDIKDFQMELEEIEPEDNHTVIVTHHAVGYQKINKKD